MMKCTQIPLTLLLIHLDRDLYIWIDLRQVPRFFGMCIIEFRVPLMALGYL